MDGQRADHALDLLFAYHHIFAHRHPGIHPADGLELQQAIFRGIDDDKADFIHMGAEEHMALAIALALFIGDHIAHAINLHMAAKGLCGLQKRLAHFPLIAGSAVHFA